MPLLPNYAIDKQRKTLTIEDDSGFIGQHFMESVYTLRGYEVILVESLKPSNLEITIV